MAADGPSDDSLLDPTKVDWNAVAEGRDDGPGASASGPGELDGTSQVRLSQRV